MSKDVVGVGRPPGSDRHRRGGTAQIVMVSVTFVKETAKSIGMEYTLLLTHALFRKDEHATGLIRLSL